MKVESIKKKRTHFLITFSIHVFILTSISNIENIDKGLAHMIDMSCITTAECLPIAV